MTLIVRALSSWGIVMKRVRGWGLSFCLGGVSLAGCTTSSVVVTGVVDRSAYSAVRVIMPSDAASSCESEDGESSSFLIQIAEPGHYVLGASLHGADGCGGIEITSSNVWLDLSGHSLVGVSGSGSGIRITEGCRNVRIQGGHVRDWGGSGVDGWFGMNCAITDLTSVGNGVDGLSLGVGGRVHDVQATGNGGDGIRVDAAGIVDDCTSWRNGAATGSSGGVQGDGIDAGDGAIIRSSTAYDNTGVGLYVGTGSSIVDSVSRGNKGAGVKVDAQGQLSGLTISFNDGWGIVAGDGSLIRSCLVSQQGLGGIRVSSFCRVIGNHCESNGRLDQGAGIFVEGIDNRIASNDAILNRRGIVVEDGGNLVTGNFSVHNGDGENDDYVIAEENRVGPIHRLPGGRDGGWSNFR